MSARAEALARACRDADLEMAGGVSESLALIGGADALTKEGAADVALWLIHSAVRCGLGNVAANLYSATIKPPVGHSHPYAHRTRATLALARQFIKAAATDAGTNSDQQSTSPLPPGAIAAGVWLAGAIEGAGLSSAAADLWQTRDGAENVTANDKDLATYTAVIAGLAADDDTNRGLTGGKI